MFACIYALLAFVTSALAGGNLAWTTTPFNPPSIPLAVRSPYVSAWLPQGQGNALNGIWPTFWDGSILGWAGYIRVDSKVYNWLGSPSVAATKAVQKSAEFTSTQSVFVLACGPVDLTATFLSPIEPADLVNLSIPFFYVAVSVTPNDGGSHSVQLYMDISAEWVGGTSNLAANWSTSVDNVITHQLELQNQSMFTEVNNKIEYGSAFFSTVNSKGTTYQTAQDIVTRGAFVANGTLQNSQNTTFRAINNDWPVFALAQDLGIININSNQSAVWSIGHCRDPVVEFITANNVTQARSPLYLSRFSDYGTLISTFLSDFPNAINRANALDTRVHSDATGISSDPTSSDYAALVALSVRQAFGSLEITVSKGANGTFNTDDILIFMRDGLINTVDVIFPAWPAFMYFNPAIGKYLLLPHYEYQAAGYNPNKWAVHDLGTSYPQVLGDPNGTYILHMIQRLPMPIESTGDQLIMALSYTQKSNDTSLISSYSGVLDQWAQYLVENTLTPFNQSSTDAFTGALPNQTNLAVKGIIGIQAAADIWKLLGNDQKSSSYSSTASSYVSQWLNLAYSADKSHVTLSYGNNQSWGLLYNLYADKLLGTNLFPASVYQTQTNWYKGQEHAYGIPLDSRHTYTKSDWQIWTAAIVTDSALRNSIIGFVKSYASSGANSDPFPDWYETQNGQEETLKARPVVGGHLALLLVNGVQGGGSNTSSGGGGSSGGNGTHSAAPSRLHFSAALYLLSSIIVLLGI